jgi:hypothetical protein
MNDLTTAIAALIKVGSTQFAALASDPNYGVMYETTQWINTWPVDAFNWPTVAIYRNGGLAERQGLGTARQWRHPRVRVDIFGRNYGEVEKAMEALRSFWIADRDYSPVNPAGVVGQGYLRVVGGIKTFDIGESQALPWEKTGIQFRRLADVIIEIGD